jgi:succinate dehydrogenase / fumarate reductase flavoprotein subunit
MQGLQTDISYFLIHCRLSFCRYQNRKIPTESAEFDEAEKELKIKFNFFLTNKGTHSVDHFHKKLGHIMWNKVGMGRTPEGLREAIKEIEEVRKDFWKNVKVPGEADNES